MLPLMLVCGLATAEPLRTDHVEAEWIPEVLSIQPGVPFRIGLRLDHDDHWHTYWRNPGDSGFPTKVDWALPEGFSASAFDWPYPEWLEIAGQVVFGYEGEVLLVATVMPPADLSPGDSVRIGGTVSWLECADVCVPGGGELFTTLPVRIEPPAPNPQATTLFKWFAERTPVEAESWSASATRTGNVVRIEVSAPSGADPSEDLLFFPSEQSLFDFTQGVTVTRREGFYDISAALSPAAAEVPTEIHGILVSAGGFASQDGARAVTIEAPFSSGSPTRVPFTVFLFAFLGGLLLNLMPCVFPVISLKILGFLDLAGEDRRKVWRHGLLFAGGVLVSFWVLVAFLLAVRASVPSIGWGFQLQNPVFVIAMCFLFVLLSLNLFGVFEMGTSLTRLGGSAGAKHSELGTFLSGVLATVVATPCTGPFMGVAVGVALTQPAGIAMLVFTFLALGMATPYLVLSRFPGWLRLVPRPGPWMESLKQGMGFLLLGFALYLVWVLDGLRGSAGLGLLLQGLALAGVAAWIYGRWGGVARSWRTRLTASVLALAALAAGVALAVRPPQAHGWRDYSPELVETLLDRGEPIFIDFTATWCVTCQGNKRFVLNTPSIEAAFEEAGVARIKADWTRQEEPITSALAAFGRSGVPLYVLYGPGPDAEPKILPEILTPGIVRNALKNLAAPARAGAAQRTVAEAPRETPEQ